MHYLHSEIRETENVGILAILVPAVSVVVMPKPPLSFFPAHYVQVLKCRQQCVLDIATKPGRVSSTEDFIPSHFDLLQFAYDRGKQEMNS